MTTRRTFLKVFGGAGAGALAASFVGSLVAARQAFAAWNKPGFQSKTADGAISSIDAQAATPSDAIKINAPFIAENGAVVPLIIESTIPNTESISVVIVHNPFPLAAIFTFDGGAQPYVSTRIKMGKSSPIKVFVKAGGRYYVASRSVKVTVGGCGG